MTTIIGIDPGVAGGISWNGEGEGVNACGMPREEEAVVELLRSIIAKNANHRIVAFIELVTGYAGSKGGEVCPACQQPKAKGEPGSRMFTFGRGVGIICGALRMAGIEITEVSPRTWQKTYYVNLASEDGQRRSKSERKRILRDIAQRRFMGLEVTLKTADALLIYHYGSLQAGQELEGIASQERPTVPIPFLTTHAEQFEEMKSKLLPEVLPGDGKQLFIGNWKGHDAVFQENGTGATFLHLADKHDRETLPRGSQWATKLLGQGRA